MSLDFEVSTIATMTVPDSWRLSLESPRYSTIAPPVGVTRMSRSVSHPLLRSIHPSPSVLSTPQSVERYRRRSASKDSSNAVNPIQLSASHFRMAQILATKNAADWSGGECQIERRSKMTESNVQPFDFKGNQVRILADKKGEPWFVAKDVCNVLGITNNRDAISELDTDEKNTVVITDGIPGNPNKTIVSEAGLYRLVMKSRKPEAKEFQRWVTHEVLPSIRRHGVYATDVTIDSILNDPDFGIRLLTDLKDERARRREAERAIEAQKPKVLFADAVATSKRSILIGELAKILKQNGVKTGQNRLFKQLREDGFLMKRNGNPNMPTQKSMELGLFEVKETSIAHSDGHVSLNFTTKVTPKGQQYLIQKYLGCTPLDLEAGA